MKQRNIVVFLFQDTDSQSWNSSYQKTISKLDHLHPSYLSRDEKENEKNCEERATVFVLKNLNEKFPWTSLTEIHVKVFSFLIHPTFQNFTIQVHQTISIFSYHRKWKLELNFCISWTRMCKCFFYFVHPRFQNWTNFFKAQLCTTKKENFLYILD